MTYARSAIRGRIAVAVVAAFGLAGLLAQQTATIPAGHALSFKMACVSEAHPEWGQHGCGDPAWAARG